MRQTFQGAGWAGLMVVTLLVSGCGTGDGGAGDGAAGDGGAQGFKTPEAALDAYGKALEQGDEAAYRMVMVKDKDALEGLDAVIALQTDMKPAEAAKVNLQAMADVQGFGKVASKRFAAEIDGDNADIVHVFEDTGILAANDKFRKWKFTKSGDQWYLVGSEFGDAKDLPEKYAWDKNIGDVSDAMRDFVSDFDGTSEKVEAALEKYAKGVDTNMGYFGLESPTITAKDQNDGQEVYTLKVKSGSIMRTFQITWKDGKIRAIKEME